MVIIWLLFDIQKSHKLNLSWGVIHPSWFPRLILIFLLISGGKYFSKSSLAFLSAAQSPTWTMRCAFLNAIFSWTKPLTLSANLVTYQWLSPTIHIFHIQGSSKRFIRREELIIIYILSGMMICLKSSSLVFKLVPWMRIGERLVSNPIRTSSPSTTWSASIK